MRKWLPTSLVLLVVLISLVAWRFSRPVDPVETHRRAFKEAFNERLGITWHTPLDGLYRRLTKTTPKAMPIQRAVALEIKMRESREALVVLGCLAEREFALTNTTANSAVPRIWGGGAIRKRIPKERAMFCQMSWTAPKTNALRVVAYPQDMRVWGEVIRAADVPPEGK